MKPRIGIIGNGNVGSTLARGLEHAGYAVRTVGSDPAKINETGEWAEVVILAVPYGAVDDVIRELGGSIQDKTLVDVTMPGPRTCSSRAAVQPAASSICSRSRAALAS